MGTQSQSGSASSAPASIGGVSPPRPPRHRDGALTRSRDGLRYINVQIFFQPARRAEVKAPEGWRSPRRSALFEVHEPRASVLECGGPPPLFIYLPKCINPFQGSSSRRSETQAERRRVQRRRGSSSSRNREGDICGRLPPNLRRCPSPRAMLQFRCYLTIERCRARRS